MKTVLHDAALLSGLALWVAAFSFILVKVGDATRK